MTGRVGAALEAVKGASGYLWDLARKNPKTAIGVVGGGVVAGTVLTHVAGDAVDKAGNAAEKTGDAAVKIAAAVLICYGVYRLASSPAK